MDLAEQGFSAGGTVMDAPESGPDEHDESASPSSCDPSSSPASSLTANQDRWEWIQGGPAVSLAVFSVQAAVVSSTAANAQGLALSIDRISLHLGSVKSASRPGSTTAALFALRDVPVPRRGLRVSLAGIQLGVATAWVPRMSREGTDLSIELKVSHLDCVYYFGQHSLHILEE